MYKNQERWYSTMRVGMIGSRTLQVDLEKIMPKNTSVIISGGAMGIDSCAKRLAKKKNITYEEYLPEYTRYGKRATLIRNDKIVNCCDLLIIVWDGISTGSLYSLNIARKKRIPIKLLIKKETILQYDGVYDYRAILDIDELHDNFIEIYMLEW